MVWSIQEQEHWDYEMGAACELQNALALSRMEAQLRDPMIDNAVGNGKHVIVRTHPAYCPRTDAGMGEHEDFVSEHDTREDAEVALSAINFEELCDETGYRIEPMMPAPKPQPTACDDEVPF